MFIGIGIPEMAHFTIRQALHHYEDYIDSLVDEANWHITVLWLGPDPQPHDYLSTLREALPQAFTLTVTLTHLGRGKKPSLLWAYAAPSIALQKLQHAVLERVQAIHFPLVRPPQIPFIPHINLAQLKESTQKRTMADAPALITFPVRHLTIYEKYSSIGKIALS